MRIVKESEGLASAALLVTAHLEPFIVNAPYLTQVPFWSKSYILSSLALSFKKLKPKNLTCRCLYSLWTAKAAIGSSFAFGANPRRKVFYVLKFFTIFQDPWYTGGISHRLPEFKKTVVYLWTQCRGTVEVYCRTFCLGRVRFLKYCTELYGNHMSREEYSRFISSSIFGSIIIFYFSWNFAYGFLELWVLAAERKGNSLDSMYSRSLPNSRTIKNWSVGALWEIASYLLLAVTWYVGIDTTCA